MHTLSGSFTGSGCMCGLSNAFSSLKGKAQSYAEVAIFADNPCRSWHRGPAICQWCWGLGLVDTHRAGEIQRGFRRHASLSPVQVVAYLCRLIFLPSDMCTLDHSPGMWLLGGLDFGNALRMHPGHSPSALSFLSPSLNPFGVWKSDLWCMMMTSCPTSCTTAC